jgi:hypothetical protein
VSASKGTPSPQKEAADVLMMMSGGKSSSTHRHARALESPDPMVPPQNLHELLMNTKETSPSPQMATDPLRQQDKVRALCLCRNKIRRPLFLCFFLLTPLVLFASLSLQQTAKSFASSPAQPTAALFGGGSYASPGAEGTLTLDARELLSSAYKDKECLQKTMELDKQITLKDKQITLQRELNNSKLADASSKFADASSKFADAIKESTTAIKESTAMNTKVVDHLLAKSGALDAAPSVRALDAAPSVRALGLAQSVRTRETQFVRGDFVILHEFQLQRKKMYNVVCMVTEFTGVRVRVRISKTGDVELTALRAPENVTLIDLDDEQLKSTASTLHFIDNMTESDFFKELAKRGKDCSDPSLVKVGCRVAVFWNGEGEFFEGVVTKERKGKKPFYVEYDDGDKEWVNFEKELFHLVDA